MILDHPDLNKPKMTSYSTRQLPSVLVSTNKFEGRCHNRPRHSWDADPVPGSSGRGFDDLADRGFRQGFANLGSPNSSLFLSPGQLKVLHMKKAESVNCLFLSLNHKAHTFNITAKMFVLVKIKINLY